MNPKGKLQEGLVSYYLNRRVSRPLAKLLVPTPVTPNQVSFASFVIALLSLGLFLSGHNVWPAWQLKRPLSSTGLMVISPA